MMSSQDERYYTYFSQFKRWSPETPRYEHGSIYGFYKVVTRSFLGGMYLAHDDLTYLTLLYIL
jgi:hypothetical protein